MNLFNSAILKISSGTLALLNHSPARRQRQENLSGKGLETVIQKR